MPGSPRHGWLRGSAGAFSLTTRDTRDEFPATSSDGNSKSAQSPLDPAMSQPRIRLTRADLYEKVWATAMRTLAKEFGMSDVGVAKVCRQHNIPVPPVGHWRRKETGYKVTRPELAAAKDGTEHLDIYGRERLRPEFEELARQAVPKIALASEISHRQAVGFPGASVMRQAENRTLPDKVHGGGVLVEICEHRSERLA